MKIKLTSTAGEHREDLARLAISLLSHKGECGARVYKVSFKHHNKKYKFKFGDTKETIKIKYPELDIP